jgi:hypothetical protein
VKRPRAGSSSQIKSWGCLTAMLLGIGSFYNPAVAAEKGTEITVVTPSTVQRPAPETAPGGTVVLRGSPVNLNASPPALGRSGNQPVSALTSAGWDTSGFDHNYDTSGIDQRSDRNYDATGFDRGFDRSGLTRP